MIRSEMTACDRPEIEIDVSPRTRESDRLPDQLADGVLSGSVSALVS